MYPDEDDENDFEEIAPGVYVRNVSDEYAAEQMGITPEALRERIEGAAAAAEDCSATGAGHSMGPHGPDGEMQCKYCGAPKLYTLAEVMDRIEEKDPGFKARVEEKVEAHRKERRRKLQ